MGGYTREAFAPARARDLAQRLNATLCGAAKPLLLSGGGVGALEQLRRDLADEAAHGLRCREPQYSAATVITPRQRQIIVLVLCATILLLTLSPAAGDVILIGLVITGYLANAVFRAWLFWVGSEDAPFDVGQPANVSEHDLPIYTVLVPVYREANMLPQLGAALVALDYPGIR